MLDLREIVVGLKPRLIGPTTSINGVYLGPFWYYFNVPPFVLSGGDPASLVYWMIIWYMATGTLLWWLLKKTHPQFALLISLQFLMAPSFFYSSRFSWSANPMPYFTMFYFLCLIYNLKNQTKKASFLAGFISGLAMQIEAAFAVLFFPFLILVYLIKRVHYKYILSSFLGFFITLIPQILFELRHGFVMTKTFFGEFGGQSSILGEKLSLDKIFNLHLESYINSIYGLFDLPRILINALFTIAIIFLIYLWKMKKISQDLKPFFLYALFFILYSFAFYMFYPYPLKGWYLLGLHIPFLILISVFLAELIRWHKFLTPLIILLLLISFINTTIVHSRLIPKSPDERSTDKSNLRNEIEAISWIYQKAEGKPFKAYNYMASVYDFPYQYLYWWHGGKKYGYHPDTVTYLDNVPEYIAQNEKFLNKRKSAGSGDSIFLIIEADEMPDRRQAWLNNFEKFCLKKSHVFLWKTEIQIKKVCNNTLD